ncbi:MAG: GntR family transcriptional regulator [Acidimicrobiales bacterium]
MALIRFRLDPRSGLPPYRQLVDQVRQAVSLGLLCPGDQLPSVREVVAQIAINPNTVHRAYRDLEKEGLVTGRPGIGTFVVALTAAQVSTESLRQLSVELHRWIEKARQAGLDDAGIAALIATTTAAGPDVFAPTP